MIYTEYKIAAQRHIESCLQFQEILYNYQLKEIAGKMHRYDVDSKLKLLSNLYYLSGYIIECSYCCAIYKFIGWTGRITALGRNSTRFDVSCYYDPLSAFSIRRARGIPPHSLNGNLHFFQTIHPVTSASAIPLIGYDISARLCYDLYDNWNAEVRYTINSSILLDYNNTFDFFNLATEVYEGLLQTSLI